MIPDAPPLLTSPARQRLAIFLKIGAIGLLVALLHVPLAMTRSVLNERRSYQRQAVEEIANVWGAAQQITGPVLAVPYSFRAKVIKSRFAGDRAVQVEEVESVWATAYFLPEQLQLQGTIDPEVRHRGIYDAVVFTSRLSLTGQFRADFSAAGVTADHIAWDRAQVLFGVSDLGGVRAVGPFRIGGRDTGFESTGLGADKLLPLSAAIGTLGGEGRFEFTFDVEVQGTERLDVVPLGKTTRVTLQSTWADPSFTGAQLPVAREIGAAGFSAEWASAHFNRAFAQAWSSREISGEKATMSFAEAAFGVRLAQPVGGYAMAERAQKYGVLFFVLVFAVFFLFEVTAALAIHPLQYAMVGAALCLFFLGFLALSEFVATPLAYGVAASACTLLIGLYSWSFLRTGRRTAVVVAGLGSTYAYLFFVLRSQDYALLAGTAALFAVLAVVMFCTRRINWYAAPGKAPVGIARD